MLVPRYLLTALLAFPALCPAASMAGRVSPGAIAAEPYVAQQGSLIYRIAVAVAPGVRGHAPNLALVYDSQGGDGVVGKGWSLEGGSSIHRCPATLADDGAQRGVWFNREDAVCLDGEKLLVLESGHWSDTEMRLRNEVFARVLPTRSRQGALGFTVETRSGLKNHYGGDSSHQIESSAEPSFTMSWLLRESYDQAGNRIRFYYSGTAGEKHLVRIEYSIHAVELEYEDREAPVNSFVSGAQLTLSKRLKTIRSWTEKTLVREYRLNYSHDLLDGSAILETITECGGGDVCLLPTVFDWDQGAPPAFHAFAGATHAEDSPSKRNHFADFNGDGRDDIYEITGDKTRQSDRIHLSLGDGRFRVVDGPLTRPDSREGLSNYVFADFDGDAVADIYQFSHVRDQDYLWLTRHDGENLFFLEVYGIPSGRSAAPSVSNGCVSIRCLKFADFDGDGRADVYRIRHSGGAASFDEVYLSNGDGSYRKVPGAPSVSSDKAAETIAGILAADFNGDGLADVFRAGLGLRGVIYLTQTVGRYRVIDAPVLDAFTVASVRFGDLNGDGNVDFYHQPARLGDRAQTRVFLARGDGSYQLREGPRISQLPDGVLSHEPWRVFLHDFNGDGRLDFYVAGSAGQQDVLLVSRSEGFSLQYETVSGFAKKKEDLERLRFADFNGDGFSDIYQLPALSGGQGKLFINQAENPRVTRITDGLGKQSVIVYRLANDTQAYAGTAWAEYPQSSVPPATFLVTSVASDAGSETANRVSFRYFDARTDRRGAGFLGFAQQESYDHAKRVRTLTTYHQEAPFVGLLAARSVVLEKDNDKTELSVLKSEYESVALHGDVTIHPRLMQKTEINRELDGTFISEVVTSFSDFDEYDNPGRVETRLQSDRETLARIVETEYRNDESGWHIGLPRHQVLTHRNFVHEDIFLAVQFVRDAQNGFLKEKIVQPNHPLAVVEHYEYDVFGNLSETTVMPHSGLEEARITRVRYDENGLFIRELVNPEGHVEHRVYDPRFGKITRIEDSNHHVSEKTYDAFGRLVRERGVDGHERTLSYHFAAAETAPAEAVFVVVKASSNSSQERTWHDRHSRVLREETTGFTDRLVYSDVRHDRWGHPVASSYPYYAGDPSYWVGRNYDELDRLVRISYPRPGGEVAVSTVHYAGHETVFRGPQGVERRVVRDLRGRAVVVAEAEGAVIERTFDAAGHLILIRDAHGNVVRMENDVFGNRVAEIDPNFGERRFSYDAFGQLRSVLDAAGQRRFFSYDRLGRRRVARRPEGVARWEFDAAPHGTGQIAEESYRGFVRHFRYDQTGQVKTIRDGRGHTLDIQRGDGGKIETERSSEGFLSKRVYDVQGRLLALQGMDRRMKKTTERNSHFVGFVVGKAVQYELRALFYQSLMETMAGARSGSPRNRELEEKFRAGVATLTAGSNLLRNVSSRAGDEKPADVDYWLQLALSRLVCSKTLLRQNDAGNDRFGFAGLCLDEMTHVLALAGTSEVLAYPAAPSVPGRELREYWRVESRDAAGRITAERFGNGVRAVYRYRPEDGQLVGNRLFAPDGGLLRHVDYTYDIVGRLVASENILERYTDDFDYDRLGRVVRFVRKGATADRDETVTYEYDAIGNLVFHSSVGEYIYGEDGRLPHAVVKAGDREYAYDRNGNLRRGADYEVRWTTFGKPQYFLQRSTATQVGTLLTAFGYDANGNRIEKLSAGEETVLYFGRRHEKLLDRDGRINHLHYLYADGRLVAVVSRSDGIIGRQQSEVNYLHRDHLGSVVMVSDQDGNFVAREYAPYGEVRTATDEEAEAFPVRRGFTGHEQLEALSLVHANGRLYDPAIGRFLSPDPVIPAPLLTQSYNRYAYVLNNPLAFTDPSGHFFKGIGRIFEKLFRNVRSFIKRYGRTLLVFAVSHTFGSLVTRVYRQAGIAKLLSSTKNLSAAHLLASVESVIRTGQIVGGAGSGATFSVLSGGGSAQSLLGGIFGGVGHAVIDIGFVGTWTPGRVVVGSLTNGVSAAISGGDFGRAVLASLKGLSLKYANYAARRAMVAQSLLNPDNADGTSAGFFSDGFKLGGRRFDPYGQSSGVLGGFQAGQGSLFGVSYESGSFADYLVEAYAGPHDFLNSFYWYDSLGNIAVGTNIFARGIGELANYTNVAVVTPFAVGAMIPDYAYSQDF